MNDHTLKRMVDALIEHTNPKQNLKLLRRIAIYNPDEKRTYNQLEWMVDDER